MKLPLSSGLSSGRLIHVALLAALLCSACTGVASAASPATPAAPAPAPKPAPAAPPAPAVDGIGDLDSRLENARARLEAAAHEVAELSARLSEPMMDGILSASGPEEGAHARSLIGAQLEPVADGKGARVREVSPGGAASDAGLKTGDVIVAINGTQVQPDETTRAIAHRLRDLEPGTRFKVGVTRGGKPLTVEVTARPAPRDNAFFRSFAYSGQPGAVVPPLPPLPALPPTDDSFSGARALRDGLGDAELVNLTPKLGQYFGAESGVLVLHAPPDAAFKLEEGDVIRSIDGRQPVNGAQVLRILRSYEPGDTVHMKVLRQHKDVELDVTLPKSAGRESRERRRRVRITTDDDLPT